MTAGEPGPPGLRADGDRVWVASATAGDVAAYTLAVEQSRTRIGRWNPVDPHALPSLLRAESPSQHTLLIHAREHVPPHALVGKVNVNSVVRGRVSSATLGYDAFDPYAGRGLFAEGLTLVVALCFEQRPDGLGLHRLEANVQPGNVRSAAVLRRLGFAREGFSPGYLVLPGGDGQERWRDHDRYAMTSDEWPGVPYRRRRRSPVVVEVRGDLGDPTHTGYAARLADELGLPLVPGPVPAAVGDGVVVLAAGPPGRTVEVDGRTVDLGVPTSERDIVALALEVRGRALSSLADPRYET